jgi:uncharacterized repeat protein (TIGR01451 family)
MRIRRTLLLLLALAALAALAPTPARAQAGTSYPSGAITSSHGRAVYTVYHPTNRAWFVEVAVDLHFGYNTTGADLDADYVSPVGRITQGNGVTRIEHQGTHLGYESGLPIVRDRRPIPGQPRNRQNGLSPRAYINTSNNQVLASQDWRRVRCTDDRVAARFYFGIRFDDGVGVNTSRRSNFVEHDVNGCNADLSVEKFASEGTEDKTTYRPGDVFAYQVNVTNPSLDAAPGTVMVDTLPVGVTPTGSLEAGCSYNATTRQVTCDIGTLRARAVAIRVFEVTVGANVTGDLVNTATVRTAATDPNLANNSDTFTLTPAPPPTTTSTTIT